MSSSVDTSPPLEAKFKDIEKDLDTLTASQIAQKLAAAPPSDADTFFTWLNQQQQSQVLGRLDATAVSNTELVAAIKKTNFKDPASITTLCQTLLNIVPPDPFPIGNYQIGNEERFCFIAFEDGLLPIDFEADVHRTDTCLTYLKCDPVSTTIPSFFLQLGRIEFNSTEDIDLDAAEDTGFIAVVDITDRKAWAIWNPVTELDLGLPPDQESISTRSTSGILPGFPRNECTAIPFDGTIDDLIAGGASSRLGLYSSNFVTVASGTTVSFGGINNDAWTHLVKVSSEFAKAAKG
ncbi:MAG: hypothetical protein MMC33_010465 [Icmadophila ericetorum]|nr:hypothetical protein [Icmadophila ericetorum]